MVGVITLLFALFLYFTATSRLDLSLVLPLFSSSYILNALLAWLILGKKFPLPLASHFYDRQWRIYCLLVRTSSPFPVNAGKV
ncbi:hypothetical protein NON20_06295 [Synechocystis sp. B12]|nr:hypothetical protein NON20_06295 [Synechocystis sp. B12]